MLGKLLVGIGVIIASLGVLVMLGLPIGRLPGDFYYRRGNSSLYFPLTTGILLSVLLTLVLAFLRR